MYLKFSEVKISGFQSIKSADVLFDSQGIVSVKGINNYEDCADSNGSGKSSVFESVVWCLYGQTSAGVSSVKNRYADIGCCVELDLSIDNENYIIVRTDTKVTVSHNGDDITCKNKTDTNKLIKEIMPFSQDVFLSTVFLSQGFNSRLGILTPSGRKERIESLTGIAEKVDEFKNNISNVKSKLTTDYQNCTNSLSYSLGQQNYLVSELERQKSKLEQLSTFETSAISIDELELQKSALASKSAELGKMILSYQSELSKTGAELEHIKSSIVNITNDIEKLKDSINTIHSKVCPTCNSVLIDSVAFKLSKKYSDDIVDKKSILADLFNSESVLGDKVCSLSTKLENAVKIKNTADNSLLEIDKSIKSALSIQNADSVREEIKSLESKLYNINKQVDDFKAESQKLEESCDIANHCLSLVSKQYRTYLLENILTYMNEKLKYYSSLVFSNDSDIVNLKSESSKLNIYLGDSLYETLSGGEKRKVDISITLTQRDLLLDIVGISCNILVLDEVMDFMDESATNSALSMIESVSDTISSMYIISHNNYDLPYDKIMKVTKSADRTSVVEFV